MDRQASDVSNMEGPMGRSSRRGSLGRAFTKLKDAMKRRSSSSKGALTPLKSTEENPANNAREPSTAAESVFGGPAGPAAPAIKVDHPADKPTLQPTPSSMNASLIPDVGDAIEADDTDEALLPMLSTRTGITEERARTLFEKYGIKYDSRQTSADHALPNKIRRVEKPLRIRIHWTCHDCNTGFGVSKTCTNCGHRRCRECPRSPAKRVRELLESTRQLQEQQEQQPVTASERQQPVVAPVDIGTLDRSLLAIVPDPGPSGILEKDVITSEEEMDISQYHYVVQHRPRAGFETVLRPKYQIVRWTCHECQTQFRPASRSSCSNCSHARCKLCPRDPARRDQWPLLRGGSDVAPRREPEMMASVQRVYKKPRQRVRWSCDRCQSFFMDKERCRNCGHERCKACIRTPSKRAIPAPDPAVLQSVEDRLAHITGRPPEARHLIAAAG